MKAICLLATILAFAVAFIWIGCKNNVTTEQPVMPSTTATPAIQNDEKGNFINLDGWKLPITPATKKEKSTWIEKYHDGRTVKVSLVSYATPLDPDHRVILDGPSRPDGKASIITEVDELSVRDGEVFCFIYSYSPYADEGRRYGMTVMSKSRFCDMDGDGKYEPKGDGLSRVVVPDWAK